jgi:tetrahydromethanopterin S-methyltransferase subunit B
MAKESIAKENPVVDALRKLKEEEAEFLVKLKPLQEAIAALEKIVDKSVKKVKPSSGTKDSAGENAAAEEAEQESVAEEAQ